MVSTVEVFCSSLLLDSAVQLFHRIMCYNISLIFTKNNNIFKSSKSGKRLVVDYKQRTEIRIGQKADRLDLKLHRIEIARKDFGYGIVLNKSVAITRLQNLIYMLIMLIIQKNQRHQAQNVMLHGRSVYVCEYYVE